MKKNLQLRILTYVVMAYMLLAFSWWTILLFQKNQDAYRAKIELQQLISAAKGETTSTEAFQQTAGYLELTAAYERQEWMIMGEAIVFVISLVIGVWLINRGYNRAITVAQQGRNFLLSITHELKSPLASIQLTLDTFMKRDLSKDQINKLSQNALKETSRLTTLVNDLLLAAKIESAYQPVPEEINMTELVQENIQKMQQKYPHATIYYSPDYQPVYLTADSQGMESMVINLLENAIKYSFEKPIINVFLSSNGKKVAYVVGDNGIGISDKEKERIFDRFYRVGNEDTRQTKGTGLGLYIVKEIVEAHNGAIRVEDDSPRGTIFKVNLPIK